MARRYGYWNLGCPIQEELGWCSNCLGEEWGLWLYQDWSFISRIGEE